jgi:hypothetical protein
MFLEWGFEKYHHRTNSAQLTQRWANLNLQVWRFVQFGPSEFVQLGSPRYVILWVGSPLPFPHSAISRAQLPWGELFGPLQVKRTVHDPTRF